MLQWVAVIFCLILVAFEILLLECMMVENFLAEVPHTLTCVEWWYLDEPSLPRFIWIVGKLIVVDLAEIDALWRILVCITGGIVFLALGYVLPRLTVQREEPR